MTNQPPGNYPPPPGGNYPPPPGGNFPQAGGQPPDNNLMWAILATIFCFWPVGIVAIMKSTQVNSLWGQGRYDEAQNAVAESKKWTKYTVIAGVAWFVLVIIFIIIWFVFIAAAVSTSTYDSY